MAKKVEVGKVSNMGTIERELLIKVLSEAKGAVDIHGATGIEQAQHFIFADDRVLAYNDRIAISAPLPHKTGLRLTVPALDLHKILGDIAEDEVSLQMGEDGELAVSSTTTHAGLSTSALEGHLLELITSLKLDELGNWHKLPKDFIKGVKLCAFVLSRDKANIAFSSVRVFPDRLLATDSWRISRYTWEEGKDAADDDLDFTLPHDSVMEIGKHDLAFFINKGGWVHFKNKEGLVFSARTVDIKFPDCDQYLKLQGETINLPPGLAIALQSILVFSPGNQADEREAVIVFGKGKVTCKSRNDRGWIERSVYMPGLKAPQNIPSIQVNPMFFLDVLKQTTSMAVGESRVKFVAGTFEHIMNLHPAKE